MAERKNLAKSVDLEQAFSRRNAVVEGLLQTGGKIVSPIYDAASYGLNQLGIRTPSFEQATGIKPFGFGPEASGESVFFRSPIQNVPIERRIIPAIPGRPGTEVGAGMPLPPAPTQPSDATTAGLKLGNGVGDNNRERSFLERMAQSGLLSTLQGMARAERMYGVGPLAAFSESALDVQAARSAAQQKAAEGQLELAKERIKAQPKPPKPSSEITNLYRQMGTYQAGLETFNRIKGILSEGIATGGAGAALKGLNDLAAAFNINLEPAAKTSVKLAVAEIRKQLIASKAFGREANRDEQKIIRTLIPEPGLFSTIKELEEAYNNASRLMQKQANETNAIMTGVYKLPSYGTVVPTSPFFTRPNQGK